MGWSNAGWLGDDSGWYLNKVAAGGGFTGPGDLTLSSVTIKGAWLLRAYSAAKAASHVNCIDIVDQAGANPLTVTATSSGDLDTASISAWVTAHSVTTILITKIYDQSGTNDLTSSGTFRPTLTLSGLGSKPVITFGGAHRLVGGTSYLQSQPYTIATISERTGNTTNFNHTFTDDDQNGFLHGQAANTGSLFAQGGVVTFTLNDNVVHAVQSAFNGASSFAFVDGNNPGALNPGTVPYKIPTLGSNGTTGGGFLTGIMTEAMFYTGAISQTDASTLNSNQHTYWGF